MSPLLPTIHEAFRGSRCEHNNTKQKTTTTQTEKISREAEEKGEEGKDTIL